MECSFSPKFRSSIRPSTSSRSGLQLVRRYSRTVQSSSELGTVAMSLLSRQTKGRASRIPGVRPRLIRVRVDAVFFLALDRDAQAAQEMEIVLRERRAFAATFRDPVSVFSLLGGNLVQANCGFQHQQHIESVLANILNHPCDLLALNDRLMDGLAQLLNQFAHSGCHGYLRERQSAR